MKEVKEYLPTGLLMLVAVIVTGIAGMQYGANPDLGAKDSWGFYLWFAPLGYFLLTWYFAGTSKVNRWTTALAGVLLYTLSAVLLLFVPDMPPGLQWHYPIGAGCLLLYFLG